MKIYDIYGDVLFENDDTSLIESIKECINKNVNLCHADLRGVDLRGVDLRGADLHLVNLCHVDLRGSDLRGVDLRHADLRHADLRYANLHLTDLRGADLRYVKCMPNLPLHCPSHGSFTAWKKVGDCLVELLIPAEARRCSAGSSKCRCDKAIVVSICNLADGISQNEVTNTNYTETLYKVGCEVTADKFDENRWNECSNGIHFFIDKEEAMNY